MLTIKEGTYSPLALKPAVPEDFRQAGTPLRRCWRSCATNVSTAAVISRSRCGAARRSGAHCSCNRGRDGGDRGHDREFGLRGFAAE
jgi:hypothetical protein